MTVGGFTPHLDLNPLLRGWDIVNWSVDASGEAVDLLLVERVKGFRGEARLVHASERFQWEREWTGLTRAYSDLCGLAKNRYVLFDFGRPGEANAFLFDGAGQELTRFWVGDYVAHLQADGRGRLWVSYFDQAFGKSYSERGLNCYDSLGQAVQPWWYCPMMDCYAMNACQEGVWHCGYSSFPLIQVGLDQGQREWSNTVRGARAIVGWGRRVFLYGGYAERARHLTTLKLTGKGEAVVEQECVVDWAGSVVGRGPFFHAIDQGIWYRLDPRVGGPWV